MDCYVNGSGGISREFKDFFVLLYKIFLKFLRLVYFIDLLEK